MAIASAAILCLATGLLVVSLGLGRGFGDASSLLLRACLSAGFGLAAFSVTYFLARVSGFVWLWRIDLAVFAILLGAYLLVRNRSTITVTGSNHHQQESAPRWLSVAFLAALGAALCSAIIRALGHPYGSGWDSFAIWNLHARFLYRGGVHWQDGFSPLIPWSHPDYPLLLPATVAHFWTVLGHETPAVSAVIGLIFTFITAGLLSSALDILSGRTSALLGGLALLSSPFFIELGTWQYADVPLSFFILATLVFLHLQDSPGMMALAGLAAGLGAWTKNEVILFVASLLVSRLVARTRHPVSSNNGDPVGRFSSVWLLFTLIPVLCMVGFFKRFIAPPGDPFSDAPTMLQKLADPMRYWAVLRWYGKEFLRFGNWLVLPIPLLMVFLYFIFGAKTRSRANPRLQASALALGLTLSGYFFIYLITPYDIYWHL